MFRTQRWDGIMNTKNKFIAFIGLPGSGKSTTAKELAKLMHTQYVYNEPEENEWNDLVTRREFYGPFNGLLWFRNTRVKGLLEAYDKFRQGNHVTAYLLHDTTCEIRPVHNLYHSFSITGRVQPCSTYKNTQKSRRFKLISGF